MKRAAAMLIALAIAAPAAAHELGHEIAAVGAASVRLVYADGKPFAYEAYELYPQGAEVPAQVGKTDAEGRVVFVPGTQSRWRLRAFSADGHGADFEFESPPIAAAAAGTPPPGSDRTARMLFGASALLAAFAGLQFFLRRKDRS